MKVKIVTANIKGFLPMRQLHYNADLYAIRNKMAPDVLGTQEAWPARYRNAMRKILAGWTNIAPARNPGCTVSLRPGLRFLESGARPLHGRVVGISDRRRIVWADFDCDGIPVTAASCHFTPRRSSSARAARQWYGGASALADFIEDKISDGIHHGAIMCDANASSGTLYEHVGRYVTGHQIKVYSAPEGHSPTGKAIDHVILWGRWDVTSRGSAKAQYSDHDPWGIVAEPIA